MARRRHDGGGPFSNQSQIPGWSNTIATTSASRQIPENRIRGSSGVAGACVVGAIDGRTEAGATFDMAGSNQNKNPTRYEVAAAPTKVQRTI
jgi:hypothetical protein